VFALKDPYGGRLLTEGSYWSDRALSVTARLHTAILPVALPAQPELNSYDGAARVV